MIHQERAHLDPVLAWERTSRSLNGLSGSEGEELEENSWSPVEPEMSTQQIKGASVSFFVPSLLQVSRSIECFDRRLLFSLPPRLFILNITLE
jgi:hypothetical protein